MTDIVTGIHDALKNDPAFSEIEDFNKANGFISLKKSGISIGLDEEVYESLHREADYTTAKIRIVCWLKHRDQAIGESSIRELAHEIRLCLATDENRTLGGTVIGGFVQRIVYLTADAGNSLLLHVAEITYEVQYEEDRIRPVDAPKVLSLSHEIELAEE